MRKWRHKSSIFVLVTVLIGLFIVLHTQSAPGSAAPMSQPDSLPVANQPSNCRFGVAYIAEGAGSDAWIPTLGAGWLANFSWYEIQNPYADYVSTIRVTQILGGGGARLDEYAVYPPMTDYYEEYGQIIPGLETFVKMSPGRLWMIGNEIEIDNQRQDNIMPDLYARAYHEIYHYIKSIDPTAKIAIGSVTMGTPGRIQYLDIIWDTYKELYGTDIPVDVWNVHIYILAERTPGNEYGPGKIALGTDPNLAIYTSANQPDRCPQPGLPDTWDNDPRHDVYCRSERDSIRIFSDQLYRIRRWMKDHGQQDKPLIVSEFGSLAAYDPNHLPGTCGSSEPDEFGQCMVPERVTDFLVGTTRLMNELKDYELGYPKDDHRLIQQWLWYSLYTPFFIGNSSNLLVPNYQALPGGSEEALTLVGQAYRQEALSNSNPANLVPGDAPSPLVFVDKPGDTADVTITVPYHNTGSLNVTGGFEVVFYGDPFTTQPIGWTSVDPTLTGSINGCNWEGEGSDSVSVTLSGLGVGEHPYWVHLDVGNRINETSEADNVSSGVITVLPSSVYEEHTYVPAIHGN